MKKCELCKFAAKAYCESDQASLCWDCDAKVHAANFLVARHSRTLLCNICQSETPWQAAGAKLGHTVSVCESCVKTGRENHSAAADDGDDEETDEDEEAAEDQEDEGENQVVPMNSTSTTPPPPAMSCSSSDESSASGFSSKKRMRDPVGIDLCCHRKLTRSDSEDSFRQPMKHQKTEPVLSSGSTPQRQDHEHCHRDKGILTGESGAIDLNFPA